MHILNGQIKIIYLYFFMKTFDVGTHWKRLIKTLPMSTHNKI